MSNVHPFEVVGRRSETQLQVGGNLNHFIWRVKGLFWADFRKCIFQCAGLNNLKAKPFHLKASVQTTVIAGNDIQIKLPLSSS